jgi:hypothetical protein
MKNRILRAIVWTIALFAAAVVVLVAVVVAGFLLHDRSAELNRSLEVLLREHLKLASPRVTQTALTGRKNTDPSGYWSVVVDEEPSKFAIALRDAGFQQSDDDDDRFFRSLLQRELKGGDLTAYHAFEAHLTLGDGTICETYRCNVVILFTDESPTIFIAIWKI